MEEKFGAGSTILMAAASCGTKAMSLFKRTLVLSPAAAPKGMGTPSRCCPLPPAAWPSKDWARGEGVFVRLLSPTAAGLCPQSHSCSTSATSVCLLCPQDSLSSGLKTCYKYLHQTSRSFSVVIQALDEELRHAVCIFYLILRALDTLEDDMTISIEKKVPLLHNFHSYLYEPDWRFMESKEKDRQVLEDFPTISLEFRKLALKYQTVIANSSRKMGFGMAEFLNKQVTSEEEWDKYCHYVAGLVGIGLSQLFSASELEDPVVGNDLECANSMGLFLQKTNIIRDYLDDHKSGREFWPQEVWSKYVKKLGDFAKPENIDLAVQCMNELITNALRHIPDVITYLSRLRNQSVFNFCAIPQVMAIATLATCYNNQQVFKGVVKIRKGQTVTLMMDATNMPAVKAIIDQYMEEDIGAAQDFGGALNEARLEFLSRIIVFELGEMLEANQSSCLQVRSVKLRLVYANTLSN
ncbi:squalene synthase isoform X2 [Molossus molossus]|uniref:Squalene synthase n=1 Tax=Molossus molossus TaxID=27622 RepID=A0A7J8I5Z9_MOLMO|nr:squalene synthase isoform X2 [Molossus molossus]KAF6479994.1 farnesyl-diphosphate farnesyltransferase 1 [Molossus molossus]